MLFYMIFINRYFKHPNNENMRIINTIHITLIVLLCHIAIAQNIGINDSGAQPDYSAILDVSSPDKGILIPRLNATQISILNSPADGLLVYNTDDGKIYIYRSLSLHWTAINLGPETITPIPTVLNPATGEIWMDRNLGAAQVATSSTDASAYGDLYQWGRSKEGHESRTSLTTAVNATTHEPDLGNTWDGLFITEGVNPWDWLSAQNHDLWQGVDGTNNVCPSGFRIPTQSEWVSEIQSWDSEDADGAFSSPLKLPAGGGRQRENGSNWNIGTCGYYWSSTVSTPTVQHVVFCSFAGMYSNGRAFAFSVRCIKD